MFAYILKRLLMLIPVLVGVTFVVFSLMYITPGDPAQVALGSNYTPAAYEQMRQDMGLNKSFIVQYVHFLFGYEHEVFGYRGLVFGDLGRSYVSSRNVFEVILGSFPNTLRLAIGGLIFALAVGIPIGVLSAIKPYSFLDMFFTIVSLGSVSMPIFWLAMVLIYFFANTLQILPAMSYPSDPASLILPIVTLGINSMAVIMRMTRSSMIDVMSQDYIRTAYVKGVPEGTIIRKHALRNALIPIVTVAGLQFGQLLGGAVLTEKLFAYPGIGTIMVDAIYVKDTPQILGSVCFIALVFTLMNLGVDVLYGLIDPRLREKKTKKRQVNK